MVWATTVTARHRGTVHHRSPNISVHRAGHGSTIRAPLSACSRKDAAPVVVDFVSPHMTGVGLTSEPIIRAPIAGAGSRTGPASMDHVGAYTRWHSHHRITHPLRQPLGRSMQWFLSQQEHSSPAYFTPQLGVISGADKPWESPIIEAPQVPSGSTTTLIPAATVPRPPMPA